MNFVESSTWQPDEDGGWASEIDPSWTQGRTAFGGLIVAAAVRALEPPERSLRSVMASFVAPVREGAVHLSGEPLRSGRSVTQSEAMVTQGGSSCARIVAAFAQPRTTAVSVPGDAPPDLPEPDALVQQPFIEGLTPAFTQHFDFRWATLNPPFSGSTSAEIQGWIRLRSPSALDAPLVLAMLDAWPSPVLSLTRGPTPASTVQWFATLSDLQPARSGEWCRFASTVHHASGGHADFTGQLWDAQGRWLAGMRQLVAEFSS